MIRRIVPPPFRRRTTFAFGHGEQARALRVIVDGETVPDCPELEILLTLARHPAVDVIGTDLRFPSVLTIDEYDADHQVIPFAIVADKGTVDGAVWGRDPRETARLHASGNEEAASRAYVLAKVASRQEADALATADPYLLSSFPRGLVEGANPQTIGDAVALLGLFLRVREEWVLDLWGTGQYRVDRATFYWELTRAEVPASWRWFSACAESGLNTPNEDLLLTAQSGLERIERSFRARDRLHARLQAAASRDDATDALFYFDVALFMLSGAFDVLAKVAHVVHNIPGNARGALWSNTNSWMKKVAVANPTLRQLMMDTQPCRDAHELISILRNTIHYDSLRTTSSYSGGKTRDHVVVPSRVEAELATVVSRLGTLDDFGLSWNAGRLHIEPGTYIERAMPLVFRAINEIMEATPVEILAGINPTGIITGPDLRDNFYVDVPERVRLLGGVG